MTITSVVANNTYFPENRKQKTFVWFSIDLYSLKGNISAKFQYCDRIHLDRAQIACIASVSARVRRKSWDESKKLRSPTVYSSYVGLEPLRNGSLAGCVTCFLQVFFVLFRPT